MPSLETLIDISILFNVSLDYLAGKEKGIAACYDYAEFFKGIKSLSEPPFGNLFMKKNKIILDYSASF